MGVDSVQGPVTIYTVAERAGVSVATVSRVLRGSQPTSAEARTKVLAAVDALGYVPLRNGRGGASRLENHGLVINSTYGPYHSELLIGYGSMAARLGHSVTMLSADSVDDLPARVIELASKVDGMAIGPITVDDDVVAEVARKVPVVQVARTPVAGCDTIFVPNQESMVRLAKHVIRCHGRLKVRFAGDPDIAPDIERRYRGYLQAVMECGLPTPPGPYRVSLYEESGRALAHEVAAELPEVDAVLCGNDELACALILQLADLGVRVPHDLAVTGWDDIMTAKYLTHGLTTVRQPVRELGRRVAARLHERIASGAPAAGPIAFNSGLVIRGSCGCNAP